MKLQGSWRSQLEYGQHNVRGGARGGGERLLKRTIKRSKSVVDLMLFGSKYRTPNLVAANYGLAIFI